MPNPEIAKPTWDHTLNFLAELTSPISEANNPEPPESLHKWRGLSDRNLGIFTRYAGTDESGEKVGRKFGVYTREGVRQIVTATLKSLHANAPEILQEKYPWESLSTDKRGRLTAKVAELVTQGKTILQIEEELDIGDKELHNIKPTLRRRGIELPPTQKSILARFTSLNNPDTTDEKLQELLDSITIYRYLVLHKAGLIVDLSSLARKAGLFVCGRDILAIYNELRQQQCPVGTFVQKRFKGLKDKELTLRYYFTAAMAESKGIQILQGAPPFEHLKKNHVRVIAGQTDKIPNTNELLNSGEYGRIGILIKTMRGVRLSPLSKIKIADIVEGSPVPVYLYTFRTYSRFYYPLAQEEELKKYVEGRLRAFGLMN